MLAMTKKTMAEYWYMIFQSLDAFNFLENNENSEQNVYLA